MSGTRLRGCLSDELVVHLPSHMPGHPCAFVYWHTLPACLLVNLVTRHLCRHSLALLAAWLHAN